MNKKNLKYFKNHLNQWLAELAKATDCNLENLNKIEEKLPDLADQAYQSEVRNYTQHFCDRRNLLVKKINQALQEIADGTYGVCQNCEEDISIARLKAQPITQYCIDCKTEMENQQRALGS
jgi:DnaK suppressor protein